MILPDRHPGIFQTRSEAIRTIALIAVLALAAWLPVLAFIWWLS